MKKLLIIIFSATAFSFFGVQSVFAQWTVTCVNCSSFGQQMIDFARQGLQLGKETVTAGASTVTATQQTLSTVKQTITDPLKNAMTLAAIFSSSNQIRNLILGTTGGKPLLKSNPSQHVKNAGKTSVNLNLGFVANQNGPYTDSILSSVISSFKNDDTKSKLTANNRSSIPVSTQREKCTDSALTSQAKRDVMRSDNTYSPVDFQKRKLELYNVLCTCNPSTDLTCSRTLTAVNKQSPSLESFYAVTQGENEYTVATKSLLEISKAEEEARENAKEDLDEGGGIASQTECTVYGADIEGNPLCAEEEVTILSSQLKESYTTAVNTPLMTQIASFGTGAYGVFSDIIGIIGGVSSITGAFDRPNAVSNVSIVSRSTQGTDEIAKDPAQKRELVAPIRKQLETQMNELTDLETINRSYLSEINAYTSRLDSIKGCYDSLITDYPTMDGSSEITSALSFYTNKKSLNATLSSRITAELSSIPALRENITTIMNNIESSGSTQGILDQFSAYQNEIDLINLPLAVERENEFRSYQESSQKDLSSDGNVTYYINQCAVIRANKQTGGSNGGGDE